MLLRSRGGNILSIEEVGMEVFLKVVIVRRGVGWWGVIMYPRDKFRVCAVSIIML
jgi:hypothetical protein